MTTVTINHRQIKLTIEQKAALLSVFDIHETGHLACTSGDFDSQDAYAVHQNWHPAP